MNGNGRLKVTCRPHEQPEVYVIAKDRDDLHLPVRAIRIHSQEGEAAIAVVELYLGECNVAGADDEGNRHHLVAEHGVEGGVVVHPHVRVDGESVRAVDWSYQVRTPEAHIEVTP
jgi:hypothetical protein